MQSQTVRRVVYTAVMLTAGVFAGRAFGPDPAASAQARGRVFEIRTYTTNEGRLDALNARFRDHTTTIFTRHGMENIGYWVPQDTPNTLVYIIAHASREQAKKNWAEFGADPEWVKVKAESEAGGKIVTKVESVFADPTDYSPIR